MDAFFAAVEARDNPALRGLPLIIGALPHERGVVSTCSYEARMYGVRSAMSIKEAYRLCPHGVYMHANFDKYSRASKVIKEIWGKYSDLVECVSLDEGYIDITGSILLFGSPLQIALAIKREILENTGLTCSIGVGYSKMAAKLASEEQKPDGLYQILSPEELHAIILSRNVRVLTGVGEKTASELNRHSIMTVGDLLAQRDLVIKLLKNHGKHLLSLAEGIDDRAVVPSSSAQSLGKEHTFQHDVNDTGYLSDVLRLFARELSFTLRLRGVYCRTVTLKVTYNDMKRVTRSKSGNPINKGDDIYRVVSQLLDKIEKRMIRLIGISLNGFEEAEHRQMSLLDQPRMEKKEKLDAALIKLQKKHGAHSVVSASELASESRLKSSHFTRLDEEPENEN